MSALESSSVMQVKISTKKNRLQNPKDFREELSNTKMQKAEIKSYTILYCRRAQQIAET